VDDFDGMFQNSSRVRIERKVAHKIEVRAGAQPLTFESACSRASRFLSGELQTTAGPKR
jgi:hypothetical protein